MNSRSRDKAKKKLFRESLKLDQRYVKRNHLKHLRSVLSKIQDSYDVFQKEIMFLCWAYDLEFWTADYASENYGYSKGKLRARLIQPLMKAGYVHKYFDRLTPSQKLEDHLFREETKANYRVRYAITQKARLLVQRFYKNLEDSVS